MADADLALSLHDPLAGAALPEGPGYRLEAWPLAFIAKIVVKPGQDNATAGLHGFAALPEMLTALGRPSDVAMRLGPDEALLARETAPDWAHLPETATKSVIEISHSLLGFTLKGSRSEVLLATGCPIDVQARAFPPGMATRTVFGKFDLCLWRTGSDEFRFLVARSSALAFLAYLELVFAQAPA